MELRVKHFANMMDAGFDLLDDTSSVIVSNMSSTGKTTIARILYGFLTGEVRGDMVSKEADSAEAELVLGGKEYRMVNSLRDGKAIVDRVINRDYAQYLVLTEVGPMYAFYSQPDKFSPEIVVNKVVSKPNTKEIDEELGKLEQSGIAPKLLKEYEETLAKYERELQEVEGRLAEVSEKLDRATRSERAEVLIKKQRIAEDIARIERQISLYEEEVAKLSSEINPTAYDELKMKRRRLGEDVERLERQKLTLTTARDILKNIYDSLRKLVAISDTLSDLNVYLFGNPLDPDTVASLASDCEAAIETVVSKIAEVDSLLSSIRQELSVCDAKIRQYNERFNRREVLLNEIQRLQEEKRKLEYERVRVEREANRILQETGKTEAELLKEYVSREDLQKMMSERSKLQSRRAELITTVESLRNMVASLRREVESEALRKRYEELKRRKAEIESSYQRDYRLFLEKFKESMEGLFEIAKNEGVRIRHFDPKTLRFERPGHTFSKSERLLLAASYVLATAKALCDLGYPVPYVVIDVLSPIDSRYERALISMAQTVPAKVIILTTKNENAVKPLTR